MKMKYNYILTAFSLILSAAAYGQTATEGYHDEGKGVATNKTVSLQNPDGSFTLTLETFATGSTAVVQRSIPSDIVLILDVSSSMGGRTGSESALPGKGTLSYNEVVRGYDPSYPSAPNYLWAKLRDNGNLGTRYQLFGLERDGRYYIYWVHTDGYILFLSPSGEDVRATGLYDTSKSEVDIANVRVPEGAASSTDPDAALVTLPASTASTCRLWTGSSRIRDLKNAVYAFIEEIDKNDSLGPDGNPRPGGRLGNRISLVTFSGYKYGDDCSARLNAPLTALSESSVRELQSIVTGFTLDSGTRPNDGFSNGTVGANHQFATSGRTGTVGEDFNRTVVFFTDGNPDGTATDADSQWNKTISSAYISKHTYGASVYSVLLLSSPAAQGDTPPIWEFMNYNSSNYPDAQSISDPGTGGGDYGFFQDASGNSVNLSNIFRAIAQASGGSASTVGVSTQVRDIVSDSFKLPIDTSTMSEEQIQAWADANVKVYTSRIYSDGSRWHSLQEYNDAVIQVEGATVTVSGFDFTKDDIKDEDGFTQSSNAGNWVGKRYSNASTSYYAGKKLVIKFNILAIDDATGGDKTQTNAPGSGVYVWNEGEQTFENVNSYEVPITNLPINLVIKKTGLRHGESATFEIESCIVLRDIDGSIVYNEHGKPMPHVVPEDDPLYDKNDINTPGWHDWSKVVLTNKGADGAEVTKTLRSLDSNYVYRIVEDKWGWSYDVHGALLDGDYPNTSNQLTNPFRFQNVEKADAVKHAESVVINHFATSETADDAYKDGNYKSSKVKSF